ncbi:MAG: alpha/beta hydrolase [Acidimicrobiales bacterium]|nr:alpha/beta hydrolase [Acidimicrobiales bacterium]
MAGGDLSPPSRAADCDLDAVDVEVDAAPTGRLTFEQRPQREGRPPWVDPIVCRAAQHPPASPTDQLDDDRFETSAVVGEAVFDVLRAPRRVVAYDEPVVDEFAETFREQRWADPRKSVLQFAKGSVPEQQLAHDEQRPPISNSVECPCETAELAIRLACLHGRHSTIESLVDGGGDMQRASNGMAYRRAGDGPTVVLVHGIPGQGLAWERVEAGLRGSFDVVTPDLVGFGKSDGPNRPTIESVGPAAQATALEGLLDDLGVRSAIVVGHDFGAPVGVLLAGARPDLVSALSLLSGNTFPDTRIPFPLSLTTAPVIGGLFSRLLFSGPSLGFMLRQGTGPGSTPPDAGVYLGDRRQRRTIAAIFSGALTRLDELYAPVAEALEGIDVPTLVGWGDHDPFFPVAQGERTATVANGRLRLFEGAGHFLPHERPTEVAREIEEFATSLGR